MKKYRVILLLFMCVIVLGGCKAKETQAAETGNNPILPVGASETKIDNTLSASQEGQGTPSPQKSAADQQETSTQGSFANKPAEAVKQQIAPSKADQKNTVTKAEKQPQTVTEDQDTDVVTIRIVCGDKEILTSTKAPFEEEDTVFTLLKRVTKENKIQMESSGIGKAVYISGIANVYEFDEGPESGWMYRVNGEFQSVSCGSCKLKSGDKVEWMYTKNLGKDLNASV